MLLSGQGIRRRPEYFSSLLNSLDRYTYTNRVSWSNPGKNPPIRVHILICGRLIAAPKNSFQPAIESTNRLKTCPWEVHSGQFHSGEIFNDTLGRPRIPRICSSGTSRQLFHEFGRLWGQDRFLFGRATEMIVPAATVARRRTKRISTVWRRSLRGDFHLPLPGSVPGGRCRSRLC